MRATFEAYFEVVDGPTRRRPLLVNLLPKPATSTLAQSVGDARRPPRGNAAVEGIRRER